MGINARKALGRAPLVGSTNKEHNASVPTATSFVAAWSGVVTKRASTASCSNLAKIIELATGKEVIKFKN